MMDQSMESSTVPPGFRFHPTDEELVGYYLRKKIASQKIDLDVIRDIDLYRIEPWDLQERCRIGYKEQSECYFFSHKDKKYPTGTRTNRATMAGFWKATGRDKAVYEKARLIGMRKTLVFYKGRAPNGQKSDWIMHEYRLESDENGPPQEEGWVVCRAFKKRATGSGNSGSGQSKAVEGWESNYFYDEPSGVSSIVNPITDFISRHPPSSSKSFLAQKFMCKQEIEADNLSPTFNHNNIIHQSNTQNNNNNNNDPFVQLPPLESPSLPLIKRPSSVSLISELNEEDYGNYNGGLNIDNNISTNMSKKVTSDWRALDKFVASQLSHDEQDRFNIEINGESAGYGIGNKHDQDFDATAFMLLQSDRDQNNKLSVLSNLSSSEEVNYDFGLCIFEK